MPSPLADWYPDPLGRFDQRFWDGQQWTQHVAARGWQGLDPVAILTTQPSADRSGEVEPDGRASMPDAGADDLLAQRLLVINQKAQPFGSKVAYRIFDPRGRRLGTASEVGRNLAARLYDSQRHRTDGDRAYWLEVADVSGHLVLTAALPERDFEKRTVFIGGADGRPVGEIVQETSDLANGVVHLADNQLQNASYFAGRYVGAAAGAALGSVAGKAAGWVAKHAVGGATRAAAELSGAAGLARDVAAGPLIKHGHARFTIRAGGHVLGSIHAEDLTEWEFRIDDAGGGEIARVTKNWAGWTKEALTRADNYTLQIHVGLSEPLRTLVVATPLALDLSLKQGDPSLDTRSRRRSWD
ncbi:phospholipid scramblase-related protein [Propionicimonas sp.]|uniref:phospholipid scramblase-related protein n=1 Tax=Propionicimonas sp. TaxID=1955623 RepID=UPI0039E58F49